MRFTYDDNYFNALYQGIPQWRLHRMVEKMLADTEVRLNVDYLADKAALDALAEKVVYTGPVDAYFGYRLGALQYRSVRFETEVLDTDNYQQRGGQLHRCRNPLYPHHRAQAFRVWYPAQDRHQPGVQRRVEKGR